MSSVAYVPPSGLDPGRRAVASNPSALFRSEGSPIEEQNFEAPLWHQTTWWNSAGDAIDGNS